MIETKQLVDLEAGVAIRRQVRRTLLSMGIEFKEEKGWIDSVFYFYCTKLQYDSLKNKLR